MKPEELVPAGSIVSRALEAAEAFCSPGLLGHSLRSFAWGAWWGRSAGVDFDPEVLYVAALLHDTGLTRQFDNHHDAFEVAGGHAADLFLIGAGWPRARRRRVEEVVVQHMRADVPAEVDAEAHLLQVAVTLDVSGRGIERFPAAYVDEVLRAYPRGNFAAEFVELCSAQAARKPDSAAAAVLESGLADRAKANPLDARAGDAS